MIAESGTSGADLSGTAIDPQPCDLLVCGGRVLDLATDAGAHDRTAIAVQAGFIVAVGDETGVCKVWRPIRRIDASGHVVAAGFVDAHVHLRPTSEPAASGTSLPNASAPATVNKGSCLPQTTSRGGCFSLRYACHAG